jgi:hypothetical protein
MLGVLGVLVTPGAARGDVLFDTLYIFDQHVFDRAFANCIGVPPPPITTVYDNQVADDFTLEAGARITSVAADFTSKRGGRPSDGVWVQFFADEEGRPSDTMYAGAVISGGAMEMLDMGLIPELGQYNFARRFVCDVASMNLTLGPGRWWVSVQPVDFSSGPNADWYWVLRDLGQVIGMDMHARNGGTHHEGPFGGQAGLLTFDNWANFTSIGFGGPGTIPMRVEGETCRADFDGNGQVDFFDYLDFVAAFDAGDPRADFDHNEQVDFFDYLDFAAAFAAGCG